MITGIAAVILVVLSPLIVYFYVAVASRAYFDERLKHIQKSFELVKKGIENG